MRPLRANTEQSGPIQAGDHCRSKAVNRAMY